MRAVEFIRGYHGYNAGETAGFDEERAKRIVDAGYAKFAAVPRQTMTKDDGEKPTAPRQNTVKRTKSV